MNKIEYDAIRVNRVQNSSGLFYGVNIQYGWNHKSRVSDGFGKVSGHYNRILKNTSAIRESGSKPSRPMD